jgi:SAM-dependent methyltransferase
MFNSKFDRLVQEALDQDFSGWDFSWTHDRWHEEDPSWNYRQLVQSNIYKAESLLDMGTGGGEFLASLANLPRPTYASESYPPNIPVARARLAPLGITVLEVTDDRNLPLADQSIHLVINRHESYWSSEVHRILRPQGLFLTQQVGSLDNIELNSFLGAPIKQSAREWALEKKVQYLREEGFAILRAEEETLNSQFDDIGVVVFYLKIISWQIPDFSVEKYLDRLLALHNLIEKEGPFISQAHRYLVVAQKR